MASKNDDDSSLGKPFAWLRPDNAAAKLAFDEVAESVLINREPDKEKHKKFIAVDDERVYDPEVAELCRGAHSDHLSNTSAESDGEMDKERQLSDDRKIWKGTYVFSLENFPKENLSWRAGKGRPDKLAHLLLTTNKESSLKGIHAIFSFCPETALMRMSCGSSGFPEIRVDREQVSQPTVFHFVKTSVRLGVFEYSFEYTEHYHSSDYEIDREDYLAPALQWTNLESINIYPTPREKSTTIGKWNLKPRLDNGAVESMASAVSRSSELVAIKMQMRDQSSAPRIDREVNVLERLTRLAKSENETRLARLLAVLNLYGEALTNVLVPGPVSYILEPYCHYTLQTFMAFLNRKPFEHRTFIKIWTLREIFRGVAFMHSHGWLHGNIKITNIGVNSIYPHKMIFGHEVRSTRALREAWKVVIFDLDGAMCLHDEPNQQAQPRPGSAGTIGYLAPERELGPYSYPVDVWSAGIVAYWLKSGTPPWLDFSQNPWRPGQAYEALRDKWLDKYSGGIVHLQSKGFKKDPMAHMIERMLRFDERERDIARSRLTMQQALDHPCWSKMFGSGDDEGREDDEHVAKKSMVNTGKESHQESPQRK